MTLAVLVGPEGEHVDTLALAPGDPLPALAAPGERWYAPGLSEGPEPHWYASVPTAAERDEAAL